AIVAEARGIADEEGRVLDQRLEGIRVLTSVVPREHAAMRHDRPCRRRVHEEVDEIDAVAHPLIGNAARELPIEPELEVELWIEWTIRLGHQSRLPVRVLGANQLHFLATA